MRFELPEPVESFDAIMSDGAVVRLRRHGNIDGPRLIMCHGNGFATDAYFPFWQHFLSDFDVVIHDLRNHGQNPLHGSLGHGLRQFSLDHLAIGEAVVQKFGKKPTTGIYHSVSSLAAILQTAERGLIWDGLVLVDPPLIVPPGHDLHKGVFGFELVLANWAMKRPDRFADPEELAQQFRDNRVMQLWVEGAHDLLARSILRRDGDGWTLSCPRELEASVYIQNAHSTIWQLLPKLQAHSDRIGFMCADPELEDAKPNTRVGRTIAAEYGFRVETVKRTTHMLQIERPEACVESVRRFLAAFGMSRA